MPELPEIRTIAKALHDALRGHTFATLEVTRPRCLNGTPEWMRARILRRTVVRVRPRGKWILLSLYDASGDLLAINLGMGAETRLPGFAEEPAAHYRVRLQTREGSGIFIRFWWLGHLHYVARDDDAHPVRRLGPDALDAGLDIDAFRGMLAGRRGGIKAFLLDQRRIAGIGNFYAHDILARAGVHPLRKIPTLEEDEILGLHRSMRGVLETALRLGGADYERDLYGRPGRFGRERFVVGYREGGPCGMCGTTVIRIRTGNTPGDICPRCQPMPGGRP